MFAVYLVLAVPCVAFLLMAFFSGRRWRPWAVLGIILFGGLLLWFRWSQYENYRANQLSVVGVYFLTSYPNCEACVLELREDKSYTVVDNRRVVEQSNWHHEVGGDYWITYLDSDKSQLGTGRYKYERYVLKYSQSTSK